MSTKPKWAIRLSEGELRQWLKTQDIEIADPFWEHLRAQSLASNQLIKTEIPVYIEAWPGSIHAIIWLTCTSKLREWRWPIMTNPVERSTSNALLIQSITLRATLSLPKEFSQVQHAMSPLFSKPEFGMHLDNPTKAQLEQAWNCTIQVGKKIKATFEEVITDFDSVVNMKSDLRMSINAV